MRPYNIAHRGLSGQYPENTLLAIQKAIDAGADWIEFDVVTTQDGVVVISHDTRADRCTDGTGSIAEMTLAQVKQLDAGVRYAESFAGERIPTLEEALDFFEGQPVRLCVEIKGETVDNSIDTARRTIHILQRRDCLQRTVITSFKADCLSAIKTWEPLLATGLDPDRQDGTYTPWQLCKQVLRCGANFLLHRHESLTPAIVDEAHQHGFDLWTWTANTPETMRRAIDLGADAIMTNYPDALRQVLDNAVSTDGAP